jgi:hypothetical protein
MIGGVMDNNVLDAKNEHAMLPYFWKKRSTQDCYFLLFAIRSSFQPGAGAFERL